MTGAVPARRASRARSAARTCARGTRSGATARAHIVVENSYVTVTRRRRSRRGDSEIRADGLFSLGYPREDGGEEINARFRVDAARSRQPAPRVRDRRLPGVRAAVGRVPPDRRVRAAGRLRRDDDRRRRRVRRAVPEGDARRCGSTAPASGSTASTIDEGRRRGHRRGVRRLGRDLLVQRRRPAHSGRAARAFVTFPRAPLSGLAEFTATGSGTFDVAAQRRQVPRRRSVRRRRRRRPGDRHAGAARRRS